MGCPQGTALSRSIPSCITGLLCAATPALGWNMSSRAGLTHPLLPVLFLLSCASHLKNGWETHLFLEPENMKLIMQHV